MSYDPVPVHADFAAREKIAYTLLSDQGSAIIRAFGLLNERFAPSSRLYGIAHPAIFVIDPKGVITHRFSTREYQVRPEIDAVLTELRKKAGG